MSSARVSEKVPQVPQFYAGRSVFITGATGFLGKVLVERLLFTCPDIGRLYLLMRPKKDILPEKRLQQLKQSQVFDVVRKSNPSQLDKLRIVPGDVSQPRLDLSPDSVAMLHDVSLIFHSAATLKFDEELRKAVDQNVRSVTRLMALADTLPNLEAFIHVSTAYSNADLETVEERVYPSPAPLEELLALVDSAPPHLLTEITAKYIAPKPNTYTFTKAVAESAVEQHGNRRYSVAIFRPTIVISSICHPFPGWIENLNGPSGVVVGAGKGLLHVFSCKSAARADMLPVDMAIDTLICAAWETAIDKSPDVKVYNCSTYDNPTNWGAFERALRFNLRRHPMDRVLWYPTATTVENRFVERSLQLLLQTVPLHLAEFVKRFLGIKSQLSLITAEQRLRAMNNVLKFFTLREWHFETGNVRRLCQRLSKPDADIYNLDTNTIDWDEHFSDFVKGTRKYLLKERDQDVQEAKRHLRRMGYLHNGLMYVTLLLFIRLLLQNRFAREFAYGTLKLLLSLMHTAYSRVTSS